MAGRSVSCALPVSDPVAAEGGLVRSRFPIAADAPSDLPS